MNDASIRRLQHHGLVHVVYEARWQHQSGQLKQLWVSLACAPKALQRCDVAFASGRVVSARAAATCLSCVEAESRCGDEASVR